MRARRTQRRPQERCPTRAPIVRVIVNDQHGASTNSVEHVARQLPCRHGHDTAQPRRLRQVRDRVRLAGAGRSPETHDGWPARAGQLEQFEDAMAGRPIDRRPAQGINGADGHGRPVFHLVAGRSGREQHRPPSIRAQIVQRDATCRQPAAAQERRGSLPRALRRLDGAGPGPAAAPCFEPTRAANASVVHKPGHTVVLHPLQRAAPRRPPRLLHGISRVGAYENHRLARRQIHGGSVADRKSISDQFHDADDGARMPPGQIMRKASSPTPGRCKNSDRMKRECCVFSPPANRTARH